MAQVRLESTVQGCQYLGLCIPVAGHFDQAGYCSAVSAALSVAGWAGTVCVCVWGGALGVCAWALLLDDFPLQHMG